MGSDQTHRIATAEPAMVARVVSSRELVYTSRPDGEDAAPHVRAASAIVHLGPYLAILQDDANWLALVDPRHDTVEAVALPLGPGDMRLFSDRRGNKHEKLDLEACTVVCDGGKPTLFGFGSGSLPARESVLKAALPPAASDRDGLEVELIEAPELYSHLRAHGAFAGSELNIEGAATVGGDVVRIFQRGNGAPSGELVPVDASCDLRLEELLAYLDGRAAPPEPQNIIRYDLGHLEGVRLTFTDAARLEERIVLLAAAEDSPDVVRDGPITGAVVGVIDEDGHARRTPLVDSDGAPLSVKAEGICLDPED